MMYGDSEVEVLVLVSLSAVTSRELSITRLFVKPF